MPLACQCCPECAHVWTCNIEHLDLHCDFPRAVAAHCVSQCYSHNMRAQNQQLCCSTRFSAHGTWTPSWMENFENSTFARVSITFSQNLCPRVIGVALLLIEDSGSTKGQYTNIAHGVLCLIPQDVNFFYYFSIKILYAVVVFLFLFSY